jgi:hypothetical protein
MSGGRSPSEESSEDSRQTLRDGVSPWPVAAPSVGRGRGADTPGIDVMSKHLRPREGGSVHGSVQGSFAVLL